MQTFVVFHVLCIRTLAVDIVGNWSPAVVSRSNDKTVTWVLSARRLHFQQGDNSASWHLGKLICYPWYLWAVDVISWHCWKYSKASLSCCCCNMNSANKEWFTFWTGTAWWTVHWTLQATGSTWQLGFFCVYCWYSGQRLRRCHHLQQYDTIPVWFICVLLIVSMLLSKYSGSCFVVSNMVHACTHTHACTHACTHTYARTHACTHAHTNNCFTALGFVRDKLCEPVPKEIHALTPIVVINPNCILICCQILCSKILSTTFIACSNNLIPLYDTHFIWSPFPL